MATSGRGGAHVNFVVHKCSPTLTTSQILEASLAPSNEVVLFLDKRGRIGLVSVGSGAVVMPFLDGPFKRFCWVTQKTDKKSTLPFLTQSNDGHLSLYTIRRKTSPQEDTTEYRALCQYQCHMNTLGSVLHEADIDIQDLINECEPLAMEDDLLTLKVGQVIVTLTFHLDQPPEVRQLIDAGAEAEAVCVQDGVLLMVNSLGVAGIWCLETGIQVGEVLFAEHEKNITMATLSSNLQYVAVMSSQGHLLTTDLSKYFKQNAAMLVRRGPPSQTSCRDSVQMANVDKWQSLLTCVSSSLLPSQCAWANKLTNLQMKTSPSVQPTNWQVECGLRRHVIPRPSSIGEKKRVYSATSAFSQNQRSDTNSRDSVPDSYCTSHDIGITEETKLVAMTATGNMLMLWTKSLDGNEVILVDMATGSIITESLSCDSLVVLSSEATFPSLVLTPGGVSMVAFNTEQELVINRLMLYDSAGVADVLCRLNNWDRCSIPVHALEVGLQHRQLDTVAFFLKSRENVFVPHTKGGFTQRAGAGPSSASLPEDTDLDLGQVESAVELLISTVGSNITENQSKQFAEQLLQITIDYLHKVMYSINYQLTIVREAGESTEDFEQEVSTALMKVMSYIEQLRQYMSGSHLRLKRVENIGSDRSHPDAIDGGTAARDPITAGQRKLLTNWERMTTEDAITDGVLTGELPLLQFFLQQGGKHGNRASLATVVDFGLQRALEFLQQKRLLLAAQMFANLGFDVWSKVRLVCFYTPDRQLREYLITELINDGHMTSEEVSMVTFVHRLESLYSCPSFDIAKLLKSEGNSSDWERQFDVSDLLGESDAPTVLAHCGDITPSDVTNSETSSYAHVLLEWTRSWDEATRQLICLDQLLTRRDASLSEGLSAAVVWRHLVSREDMNRLQSWINVAFPDQFSQTGQAAWPYSLRFDTSFLTEVDRCTTRGRNVLLDTLARKGVFSPKEVSNFPLLVTRLARNTAVIGQPHVLEMRSETHEALLVDFHSNMVTLCLQRHLPSLLYFYLDFWGLCVGSSDLGELGLGQDGIPSWAIMLLHMRAVSHHLNDPARMFEASLAATAYIQRVTMATVSVRGMFEKGLVGQALATLVYDPVQLKQLVTPADRKSPAILKWEPALRLLPRIHAALCRPQSDGVVQQDISVYDLLQGNVPFDVAHLFGWQPTNALAAGDVNIEMAHFAQEELVAQFGHREALKYTYYLRQGRPCFAFCAYVISQLQAGAKTLAPVRLRAVFRYTHLLALRHFHQPPIAAASVAFLQMLGFDTTIVRVNVQVASLIMAQEGSEVSGTVDQRRQIETQLQRNIARMLIGCAKGKRKVAVSVLSMLEDAIHCHLDKFSIKSTSMDAALLWQLAIMFCQAHNLPPSTAFLVDCALADNWLMFLTFAQLHQYDKQLVHRELRHFSRKSLQEHLHYVVDNVGATLATPADSNKKQSQLKSRDVRAQLYSRIGLTRVVDVGDSSNDDSSLEEVEGTTETEEEAAPPTEFTLPSASAGTDVFSLLLACQETLLPWQCLAAFAVRFSNAVLAVLAACHQGHNLVSCICSWLVASATGPAQQDFIDRYTDCELREWSHEDLKDLTVTMAKHMAISTVLTAFKIFDPTALLTPFLKFCVAFYRYEDEEISRQHLEAFKTQHSNILRSFRVSGAPTDTLDLVWTEDTVSTTLCLILEMMSSGYDRGRLLKLLDQTNFTRLFTCQVPDFSRMYQLHQVSHPSGVSLNYCFLTSTSASTYEQECKRALHELESRKLFNEARVFAEVAKVSEGDITLKQLESELKELAQSTVWRQVGARCSFWQRCNDLMKRYQVPAAAATSFFQGKITQCTSHTERVLVCQVAYDWLGQDSQSHNLTQKGDLFIQIWESKIQAHLEQQKGLDVVDGVKQWLQEESTGTLPPADRATLLHYGRIPSVADTPKVKLNQEETEALEVLIGQLLDNGRVKEACQVAALLGHYSRDLNIVISCLQLSLAHITTDQLDMSVKMVMMQPQQRMSRRLSMLSMTSFTTQMVIHEEPDSNTDDVLTALEMMLPHVTRGKHCCQRIVTTYQISKVLDKPFEWVVVQDEFSILQWLLKHDLSQLMALAKGYLDTSSLTAAQVAGFLGDTILEMIKSAAGITSSDVCGGRGPILETAQDTGAMGTRVAMVTNLIQLCKDKALLGQRLHDNLKCLTSSNHEMSPKLLSVCVELLVAAHQCFTLACSMDGIAAVLHTARTLTFTLEQGDEFNLMIRLLTGVGRFSEMTYVFDILKQQHQFELLFRKGIDKEESLRLAIMDYVQRCHPSDTDTFKMVSLYFTMYREIAVMLEENAHKQLQGIRGKHLDNSSDVQANLQSALHYYSDAAESYAKENCLRHAQRCVKNARLVALQIELLNSGHKVIHLTKNEVSKFIASHQKFWEAYIVAEAYSHHASWADAILHRVVLHGDGRYLTDLTSHVPLTPTLISEVAERYRMEPHKPKSAVNQIKRLLSQCTDILTTYRLANELGLTEVGRDLLKAESGAYLQDSMALQ